ncbi:hypothetical protein JCM11641_004424 [Rhodosporidiobolus odoratus]
MASRASGRQKKLRQDDGYTYDSTAVRKRGATSPLVHFPPHFGSHQNQAARRRNLVVQLEQHLYLRIPSASEDHLRLPISPPSLPRLAQQPHHAPSGLNRPPPPEPPHPAPTLHGIIPASLHPGAASYWITCGALAFLAHVFYRADRLANPKSQRNKKEWKNLYSRRNETIHAKAKKIISHYDAFSFVLTAHSDFHGPHGTSKIPYLQKTISPELKSDRSISIDKL